LIKNQANQSRQGKNAALSVCLKAARVSKGYSQTDVAKWLGWSRGRVARYESATVKRFCVFDVRALCRLLSLDFSKVIEACATGRAPLTDGEPHASALTKNERK